MLESIGPSIKLIVVIRNPVERAYSHFLHRQSEGIETRSFLEALEDEEREIEALEKNCTPRTGYLWHSYYGQHLNHYLKTFSKENFLICSFEKDLIKEFHATMSLLWDFLGVSKIEIPEAIHVNAYRLPPRSIMWLKRLINGDASPKRFAKSLVPIPIRQKLRGAFNEFLDRPAQKPKLSAELKAQLMNRYFERDLQMVASLWGPKIVNDIR